MFVVVYERSMKKVKLVKNRGFLLLNGCEKYNCC